MSSYVSITLSERAYTETIDAIECATMHQETFDEVESLVHLIDLFEKEYGDDKCRQGEETRKWLKQQEMYREKDLKDPFLFIKITDCLKDHENDHELEMYHCAYDLIDIFEEYCEKKLEENTENE